MNVSNLSPLSSPADASAPKNFHRMKHFWVLPRASSPAAEETVYTTSMKLFSKRADQPFLTLLVVLGILAIICGGVLSAFTAAQPTPFTAWTSAYLVLVVGVAQVGFGLLGHSLVQRHRHIVAWLSFVLYNFGSLAVIEAVHSKPITSIPLVMDAGGACIILAILVLLYGVYGAKWSWRLGVFYLVCLVIAVSVPIGMVLGR